MTRPELTDCATNAVQAVVEHVKELYGEEIGVFVWLGVPSTPNTAYASNIERGQVVRALRELADRLEVGLASDPPGPRAQS